jgi:hypothetical protein
VLAIVDYGIELDRQLRAGGQQLEEIKRFLRKVGETSLADRRTEKTVQIDGNIGVVAVTYPANGPRLRAGVDLLASEEGIPDYVFKRLFRKKTIVEFAESFVEKLGLLDDEDDRELILSLVEVLPATPRVTWPK